MELGNHNSRKEGDPKLLKTHPPKLAVQLVDGTALPLTLSLGEYKRLTDDPRTHRMLRIDAEQGRIPTLPRTGAGRWRVPTTQALERLGVPFVITTA